MSGLEAVEISFKEYHRTYRLRLDSEYYLKAFLANERFLNSKTKVKFFCKGRISNIKNVKLTKPFNYLEIANVSLNGVTYSFTEIDCREIPDRATYILRNDDIAVSTVRPNRNAVAFIQNAKRLVGTSGFTILRVDKSKISPHFLFVFCKTKYFITKLVRENTATMYPAVSDYDVLNVSVPVFTEKFQQKITQEIKTALQYIEESHSLYAAAEETLLSALGMTDFVPSEKNVSVKLLSESFGATARLDAEYYQRKYEYLFRRLSKLPCKKLGSLVSIMKSIEPGSECYGDEGISFVRVSDMTKFGIQQPATKVPADIGQPHLYPKRGTVLLSKDGSVGIAYKVENDMTCVTSGALLHLTVKRDVLPDYLALILNSLIVQLQAERDAGGSVIQHWKPSEIADVIIPVLDAAAQQRITADVQRSFALRRKSEQLLGSAKRAVEIAVEDGEESAITWLRSQQKTI